MRYWCDRISSDPMTGPKLEQHTRADTPGAHEFHDKRADAHEDIVHNYSQFHLTLSEGDACEETTGPQGNRALEPIMASVVKECRRVFQNPKNLSPESVMPISELLKRVRCSDLGLPDRSVLREVEYIDVIEVFLYFMFPMGTGPAPHSRSAHHLLACS